MTIKDELPSTLEEIDALLGCLKAKGIGDFDFRLSAKDGGVTIEVPARAAAGDILLATVMVCAGDARVSRSLAGIAGLIAKTAHNMLKTSDETGAPWLDSFDNLGGKNVKENVEA